MVEGLEGFDLVTTENWRNRNDGVIVYHNKRLNAMAEQLVLGDVFGIKLRFTINGDVFVLSAFYRTFDSDILLFLDELEGYYARLNRNDSHIWLGDLNINTQLHSENSDRYLNCLEGAGFVQCIDKPTRVTDNSATCLDHIFIRYNHLDRVQAAVFQTRTTDHFSTALTITFPATNTDTANNPPVPDNTYIDYALLSHNLQGLSWDPITNNGNVNSCFTDFNSIITHTIDNSKKNKNSTTRFKKLKPWITVDLIKMIRKRDKLSKRVSRQPFNNNLKFYYRAYRQTLSIELKSAKRVYYRNKLQLYNNNPKLFWGVINELTGVRATRDNFPLHKFRPNICYASSVIYKEIADEFNIFFSNIGQTLALSIPVTNNPIMNDADYRLDCVFHLHTITEPDIIRHVTSLRGGSAPGCDNVPANVVKQNIHILAKPLLHLVNLSISTGIFPDIYKTAKVFPLYKANDYTDKNNFRPISLLSVFSKVLERVVKEQLVVFLLANKILSERQYGFREDRAISDVLFDVNKELHDSISKDDKIMLVFLDIKKAFDSIDRNKLLLKLEAIGARDNSLAWFTSYLDGRRQCVSILGVNSDFLPVDYGVVQGSTLGPILFLIYINNISKLSLKGKLFLFADDTLIFLRGKTWKEVRLAAMHDLMILKQWFDQNVLSLNVSKTKYLPLSLRPSSDYDLNDVIIHTCNIYNNLNCQCEAIEKVCSYKYLGVTFDSRMNWSPHINLLKKKLRKYIFAFKNLRDILEEKEIKLAYYAYVQSLLSFGIILWGGAFSNHIQPLNVVQKSILKVGFGKERRYPSEVLFSETGIFSIRHLYVKSLLIHIFKNYQNIFLPISHSYNTRYSRQVGINSISLFKSHLATNSFYVCNVLYRNLGNDSNTHMFHAVSLSVFKRRVSKWLLGLSVSDVEGLITAEFRRRN